MAPCRSSATQGSPTAGLRGAYETVALVGDSHAAHWRAAVDYVARARNWRGVSLARSSCPLSKATRKLDQPNRSRCVAWNQQVLSWFGRHPEVSTVFVAGLSGGRGVVVPRGRNEFKARVAGYIGAWKALPRSVEHVVVIRDSPKMRPDTLACVESAMARHRRADRACAVARRDRLDPDAAVAAAQTLRSPRVAAVDLTRFFCGPRRCYPVIGGALAYRDGHHLTPAFTATVGPFLDARLKHLVP
jgi:hypothetical protein